MTRAAEIVRGCVFIGGELAPWMPRIAEEGQIDQWCEALAGVVTECVKDELLAEDYVKSVRGELTKLEESR